MVKYLLGILTGVALVFLLIGTIVLMAVTMGGAPPSIEDDSVLAVRLSGPIPEHIPVAFSFGPWENSATPTLLKVREAFQKAARDDRIRAVALYCGGLRVGWAKAQEIRWAIEDFKKSGKPIRAFLRGASMLDYYVAAAADEISMTPEAVLDVKGLRAEVSFYKDTLAKIGIQAELERIGKYKSFAEPWSRSTMSEPFREVMNSVLDEVYGQFLEAVAPAREMTPDELRAVIDEGPFVQEQAIDSGLVDVLQYEDEFFDALKRDLDVEELHKVGVSRYSKVSGDAFGLGGETRIAVVYAIGNIIGGEGESDSIFGSSVLGADSFSRTLRKVKDDEEIEAVIVRIDSPGGDAFASDRMWREMNRLREAKPVIVSMSDVAASGGYYIAMADSPVLAYPGTTTGSIGVVYGKFNLRGLYDKLGIHKEIMTRGRYAASLSDYKGFSPEERAKARESVEAFYETFVRKVAESRGREWDEIDELAQGRVWMGSQAHKNGLVDELGGFDRAIEMAKEAAGLDPEDGVTLVPYPEPKQFLDMLLEGDWPKVESPAAAYLRTTLDQLGVSVPGPALLRGGLMHIPPYSIEIR